jgi:predicted transglutaminase-like cysteine proteinase
MRASPVGRRRSTPPWLLLFLCFATPATVDARTYDFGDGRTLAAAADLPSWADALRRARAEDPLLDACWTDAERCPRYLRGARHVILSARALDPGRRIDLVDRFIDRRAWEMEHRRIDDWRTLSQFLDDGGDCEDFAFAKYLMLRALDFAADDLRIVVARERASGRYHALLAVRHAGRTRLLDVAGATSTAGYRILYALNERSVFDHTLPVPPESAARPRVSAGHRSTAGTPREAT